MHINVGPYISATESTGQHGPIKCLDVVVVVAVVVVVVVGDYGSVGFNGSKLDKVST